MQDDAILVVDRHPAVAALVRRLAGAELRVLAAADRDSAMAVLRSRPISVLVCDEHLDDDATGLYLLARVRADHPLTQLVLIGQDIDEELLAFAINEAGVLKYLRKPLDEARTRGALDDALRHFRQAREIEGLRAGYRDMAKSLRSPSFHVRRFRHNTRLLLRHGRDLALASLTTMVALQAMFLATGLIVLTTLYLLKSAFGINLLEDLHLQDLIDL